MNIDDIAIRALNNTEVYTHVLDCQHGVLEAIAKGDSEKAIESFFSWIPPYADGKDIKLSGSNLEDRRMQGFMLLSLLLHQGYLLQVPINKLYVIFESNTVQFMCMKNIEMFEKIAVKAINDICSLIQESSKLIKNKKVVEACNFIQRNLTQPLFESEVSDKVGLSTNRLNLLFKEELRCTIYEYILNKKIQASAELLLSTNYTISEIAAELCFSSSSHFGTRFKERMGFTPLQFRKKSRDHWSKL